VKRSDAVKWVVIAAVIIYAVQRLFIAYVPNIIFMIAKYRSHKPLNTVIYAPPTDAKLRKVVLPNPDFIYNACFYDISKTDLLITGDFPDSSQYASLAFYGEDMQPYYVMNNQVGLKNHFRLRLSCVGRIRADIVSPAKQGSFLMRLLVSDSAQMKRTLEIQKAFKVQEINQNE
jgi:uncharacterized membrane protein